MIPLWAVFAFCSSLFCTALPLIQEKMRGDGFAVAVLVKIVTVLALLPFVLVYGFPSDPMFYVAVLGTAVLWSVSDVIYFRSVPIVGAGVVSRLLPSAVLLSFILWFFFDPALLQKYLSEPVRAGLIAVIILLASFFAVQIKKCAVSWQGVRMIWFVIFAATVGPLFAKLTLGYAPADQAPYALVFVQAAFMLFFWAVFFLIKKPVSFSTLMSPLSLKAGALIGICSASAVTLKFQALQLAEHPAYISIILFTDSLWIVLIHRLTGRIDNSNIWAGLGIVFCAIALIVVKSF